MTLPPFLIPWLCQGMTSWRQSLQYHIGEAEPLTMHSQVLPGNERNVYTCLGLEKIHTSLGLEKIHTSLGLKSQAHRFSPLKWTNLRVLCSHFQRTLGISPEIDFRAGGVCGLQKMEQHIR